jgi:hypothetical protein
MFYCWFLSKPMNSSINDWHQYKQHLAPNVAQPIYHFSGWMPTLRTCMMLRTSSS